MGGRTESSPGRSHDASAREGANLSPRPAEALAQRESRALRDARHLQKGRPKQPCTRGACNNAAAAAPRPADPGDSGSERAWSRASEQAEEEEEEEEGLIVHREEADSSNSSEQRRRVHGNTHAQKSWQDWGKLFQRFCVPPLLPAFDLRSRARPAAGAAPPAMVAGLWGGGARRGTVPGAWLCALALLQLLSSAPRGLGLAHGRRLICWQALLQCQGEPECSYAYSQYAEACAPVLAQRPGGGEGPGAVSFPASDVAVAAAAAAAAFPSRWRCPSHCISALIQLNHTRRGPALEDCDCAQDENCKSTKRAIEPCLPRTSSSSGGGDADGGGPGGGGGGVMGCTEARRRCDRDSRCNLALNRYLTYCGKLFNGLRCTDECRAVIEDMLAVPKAALLNDCVCDGLERPICESVKENMARLCFGTELGNGPGSSGSDGGLDDYYDDEYEEEPPRHGGEQPLDDEDGVAAGARPGGGAVAAGGLGDLPYGSGRRSSSSSSSSGCSSCKPGAPGTPGLSILLLLLLWVPPML